MAKTREEKAKLMELYKHIIENADFVMVELKPKIPAQIINTVRLSLQEVGGKLVVLKNKVFKKVASEYEQFKDLELENVRALVVSETDIVSAVKAFDKITSLAKQELLLRGEDEEFVNSYKAFEYVMGYVDKQVLDAESAKALSTLASKEELLGQLVGGLAQIIRGFMNVLNGNTLKFIYVLENLKAAKS